MKLALGLTLALSLAQATELRLLYSPKTPDVHKALKLFGLKAQKKKESKLFDVAHIDSAALLSEDFDVLKKLQDSGHFNFITLDSVEFELPIDSADELDKGWHHKNIQTKKAWEFTQGSENVIVAVCDSGVEGKHEDLKNRLVKGYNFVGDDTSDTSPGTNHGTMVSGVIASNSDLYGSVGVAPKVKIMPLKISNNGGSYLSDIIKCIEYAADHGAKVVNVSFTGVQKKSIAAAGEYAWNKGAVLIYAAGNAGLWRWDWTNWYHTIAVGATGRTDGRAKFSNKGGFLDLSAPGISIYTTTAYLTLESNEGKRYRAVNGTSFAAPIVSAVAALLYSNHPKAGPKQVKDWLFKGVDRVGSSRKFGRGRINAYKALKVSLE